MRLSSWTSLRRDDKEQLYPACKTHECLIRKQEEVKTKSCESNQTECNTSSRLAKGDIIERAIQERNF
jgi:hypothetical protein